MSRPSCAAIFVLLVACDTTPAADPTDAGTEAPDATLPDPIDAGVPDADAPDALPEDALERPLAPRWSQRGSVPPSLVRPRWGTRAVLIPNERRLIVFGGSQYPLGASAADHWSLSLENDEWTALSSQDAPAPRYCHCATYLPDQRQVLIVGGRGDSGPLAAGAWTYDLDQDTWTVIDGIVPPGVIGCSAAWMPSYPGGGRAIVFSGGSRAGLDRNTWVYDPNARSFATLTTDHSPPPRSDPMIAYDPSHGGRVLVFGGAVRVFPAETAQHHDDLWAFDGQDWRAIETEGPRPAARRFAADAFDEAKREWVIFGGTREVADFDDLWLFDGETNTWTELRPPEDGDRPTARGFAALGMDPVTGEYRLFGGLSQPDFRTPLEGWVLELRP